MPIQDESLKPPNQVIYWQVMASTMGRVLIAMTDRGVCRVAFGEDGDQLRARFPEAQCIAASEGQGPAFAPDQLDVFAQVLAAIEAPGDDHSQIALDIEGTAFQRRCWQALRDIPPGQTRSYGEQAAGLGNPKASRAVGSANAANPVAVLIPCHRVVPANGGVGGYAYGACVKAELLSREARLATARLV